VDDAKQLAILDHGQRRAAGLGNRLGHRLELAHRIRGELGPRQATDIGENRIDCSLAHRALGHVNTAHPGLRRERDEARIELPEIAPPQPMPFLRKDHDGAPFRCLVGK
jgi:hypothetical protein